MLKPDLLHSALLIDADNFNDPQAIDAAWTQVKSHAGQVSVCRAYGGAMRLQTLASLWRTLAARTFTNLSIEKNTTDAALVADAVALHFQQGVRFFAIASGDADFAPLAVRLREWGCEVWCFSLGGLLFQDADAYYHRVVRFESAALTGAAAPAKSETAAAQFAEITAPIVPVVDRPLAPALLAELLGSQTRRKPPLAKQLPEIVRRILDAVPDLGAAPQALSQVMPVLRQQGILGKNRKAKVFFAAYAEHFALNPAHQPTHIAFITPAVLLNASSGAVVRSDEAS